MADAFESFSGFFAAYVEWLRATEGRFSYRWLAKRLALKSHTLLLRFASGAKLPTLEVLARICEVFELSTEEAAYARALLGHEGAKTAEERDFFLQKKTGLCRAGTPRRRLELDTFDLLSQWYNVAVLELAGLPGFTGEPDAIAARLRAGVTPEAVKLSLARLERLELLGRDAAGMLRRAPGAVATTHNIPSDAIRMFHGQMLDLAKDALSGVATKERLFFGQTLAFDRTRLAEAQALIVEFRTRFHKLLEGGEPDSVYHLAVQFMPLTQAAPIATDAPNQPPPKPKKA